MAITTTIIQPIPRDVTVTVTEPVARVIEIIAPAPRVVTVASVGIQGPPGQGAIPSSDAGNILTVGSDSGLYVPPVGNLDLGTFN